MYGDDYRVLGIPKDPESKDGPGGISSSPPSPTSLVQDSKEKQGEVCDALLKFHLVGGPRRAGRARQSLVTEAAPAHPWFPKVEKDAEVV